jgi:hypothetical protein
MIEIPRVRSFRTRLQYGKLSAVARPAKVRIHTIAVNPQMRTGCFPFFESVTFGKPLGGSIVTGLASNILVCRRIWWRQPTSKILLQLVACDSSLRINVNEGNVTSARTIGLVDLLRHLMHDDLQPQLKKHRFSTVS